MTTSMSNSSFISFVCSTAFSDRLWFGWFFMLPSISRCEQYTKRKPKPDAEDERQNEIERQRREWKYKQRESKRWMKKTVMFHGLIHIVKIRSQSLMSQEDFASFAFHSSLPPCSLHFFHSLRYFYFYQCNATEKGWPKIKNMNNQLTLQELKT